MNTAPAQITKPLALEANKLSKTYHLGGESIQALREVSLSAQEGEFLAVMGPSGSGKSTLLYLLGLLDLPDSGEVVLAGQNTAHLDDDALTRLRRERLGFLFQSFELIPNLTAAENILLPAQVAKREAPGKGRLAQLAAELGIAGCLRQRPNQLSGGQQQRVALTRALINDPAVVLADEPTGNLDTRTSGEVLRLLRRGVSTLEWTIIMVTHDPQAALYADRIVFLRDGALCGETSTQDSTARGVIEAFVGV
jgi:putative ABC transport system ATP-binding protein